VVGEGEVVGEEEEAEVAFLEHCHPQLEPTLKNTHDISTKETLIAKISRLITARSHTCHS